MGLNSMHLINICVKKKPHKTELNASNQVVTQLIFHWIIWFTECWLQSIGFCYNVCIALHCIALQRNIIHNGFKTAIDFNINMCFFSIGKRNFYMAKLLKTSFDNTIWMEHMFKWRWNKLKLQKMRSTRGRYLIIHRLVLISREAKTLFHQHVPHLWRMQFKSSIFCDCIVISTACYFVFIWVCRH